MDRYEPGYGLLTAAGDLATLAFWGTMVFLMHNLPERWAIVVARLAIRLVLGVVRRFDRVGMRNLEIMLPEKSGQERRKILDQSYEMLARNLMSYAKIPELTAEKARTMTDFSEAKALITEVRARAGGTGVILPTLHFGRFEQLLQLWSLIDRPFTFLARGTGLRRFDNWWNTRREHFGSKVLWRKGGFRQMVDALQNGNDVGVLFDQNVKIHHAAFVEFFGRQAATTKSIALAALRTGAPIIFAVCIDIDDDRCKIFTREVANPLSESGSHEEKILRVTRSLHEIAEEVIRAHPEQWFWIHRRFKTRPPGDNGDIYACI